MLQRLIFKAAFSSVALLLLISFGVRAETWVYTPSGCEPERLQSEDALLRCFAPIFVVPEAEASYNRIGTPTFERHGKSGEEGEGPSFSQRLRIDPERAAVFAEVHEDRIGSREILQLVYRVHFERIPLFMGKYFFEAHRNPGVLILIALDAESHTPLFVSSVQGCGCYLAIMPTEHVSRAVLPADWNEEEQVVFGQALPGRVEAPMPGQSRLVVALSPKRHRVRSLMTSTALPPGTPVEMMVEPLGSLRALPVGDGRERSMFYERGPLRGHVRGAWNFMEGVSLGWLALDFSVGMDKDLGAPVRTGTPFFTELSFWKKSRTRLDLFDRVLRERGFQFN